MAVRGARGLFRACASLQLAVVLITVYCVVLAWATIMESRFGTAAVKFGIYGTGWFAALNVLLAINVLCAALIRLPWKKRLVGFLITHAGILVLLFGCLLTRWKGIDAQLPIVEEDTVCQAFKDTQHFELTIRAGTTAGEKPETIFVPFRAGPFNWKEYADRFGFPWRVARRDRGVLYDQDGIRLEVLDYYGDSDYVAAPRVKLQVDNPAMRRAHRSANVPEAADSWSSVELGVLPDLNPEPPNPGYGIGDARSVPRSGRFVFWMTCNAAETEAFLHSAPEGALGEKGQVVLYTRGKKYCVAVDEYDLTGPRQVRRRFPLGNSRLGVEVMGFDPAELRVRLRVFRPDKPPQQMWLYANDPEVNQQDYENGVFGSYWFAASAAAAEVSPRRILQQTRRPRIDILQGHDQKLYYRAWQAPSVEYVGPLPADRSRITAFAKGDHPLEFRVEGFAAHDRPGKLIPLPFVPRKPTARHQRAYVRLTLDGETDEFWLASRSLYPFANPLRIDQWKVVRGKDRSIEVGLPWDEVDLGFCVHLREFVEELYPGTGSVKNYSSIIDFRDRDNPNERSQERVLVTMNAPIDFTDPRTGRSYRLTQASRNGPWDLNEVLPIRRLIGDKTQRSRVYLSVLGLNYDPGRGVKHAGSLMIVAGIVLVLCAKAAFLRKPGARIGRKADNA